MQSCSKLFQLWINQSKYDRIEHCLCLWHIRNPHVLSRLKPETACHSNFVHILFGIFPVCISQWICRLHAGYNPPSWIKVFVCLCCKRKIHFKLEISYIDRALFECVSVNQYRNGKISDFSYFRVLCRNAVWYVVWWWTQIEEPTHTKIHIFNCTYENGSYVEFFHFKEVSHQYKHKIEGKKPCSLSIFALVAKQLRIWESMHDRNILLFGSNAVANKLPTRKSSQSRDIGGEGDEKNASWSEQVSWVKTELQVSKWKYGPRKRKIQTREKTYEKQPHSCKNRSAWSAMNSQPTKRSNNKWKTKTLAA